MRSAYHHLAKRGSAQTWYVVLAVPKALRPVFGGKHHLLKNLATTDSGVALGKRTAALGELEALLRQARRPGITAELMAAAATLHREMPSASTARLMAEAADYRRGGQAIPPMDNRAAWLWEDAIDQAASEATERYGASVGVAFEGVARGTATPLLFHLDTWLAEPGTKGPLNPRTKDQRRSVFAHLEKWLTEKQHLLTVEGVTKPVAGAYIADTFITPGVHAITANSKISVLSSYWRWMGKRVGAAVNPWSGQSFRKPSKRMNGDRTKRPFTQAEMVALLTGKADSEISDAIRIAALSGMRLEELYRLKAADCAGGVFDIRQSKTDSGVRKVPIHTALSAIVERRLKGKTPGAFLMHEVGAADGRERSAAVSKRFGRYRQSVGAHDREEGQRHSRVDFHSFRRWFITEARKGFDRAVVAGVVGHENGNITDDVYSGGPDMDTKRRCVESVLLPPTA